MPTVAQRSDKGTDKGPEGLFALVRPNESTGTGRAAEAQRRQPGPPGLVTCATTARDNFSGVFDDALASAAWSPKFPSPAEICGAAAEFGVPVPRAYNAADLRSLGLTTEEGPRPFLTVAPGAIRLSTVDLARAARRQEKDVRTERVAADMSASWLREHMDFDEDGDPVWPGEWPADADPSREIVEWSRRSRSRMTLRLAELDYTPLVEAGGLPAMVTLTYPGDWETVAPNGRAVKAHLRAFFERFKRAWGGYPVCVWKLEFQRRGAPHYHLFMVPPTGDAGDCRKDERLRKLIEFYRGERDRKPRELVEAVGDGMPFRDWLSWAWADIVDHPNGVEWAKHVLAGTGVDYAEGTKASDPKRLAVYFTKHGTFAAKEYQHIVPASWSGPGDGPGRFWGYRGLEPARAAVELDWEEFLLISRTLRRLSGRQRIWDPDLHGRGNGGYRWVKAMTTRTVDRLRVDTSGGEHHGVVRQGRRRRVRVPVRRFAGTSGFLCVNDAPKLARTLSRLSAACLN